MPTTSAATRSSNSSPEKSNGNTATVSYISDVATVVRGSGFRRLLSVRMAGQFADGVFQTALASYVLFSPERQTDAQSIASAFAILLLPYCVLGPFVGVFIDRWQRRQILLIANFARAVLVTLIALIALSSAPEIALLSVGVLAISINRLVLSALGASIPRVVPLDNVVTANAIAPTLGTLSTVLGAGLGVYLRSLFGGGTDTNDAILIAVAAGLYVMAGSLALRLGRRALGPEPTAELPTAFKAVIEVARELGAGVSQIRRNHAASIAFVVTAIQRFSFGIATVTAVLLARNTFSDPQNPDAGLAVLAQVVLIVGAGFLVGAVITPELSRYLSPINILIAALSFAAITQLIIAASQTKTPLLIGVFFIGISAQVTKVSVDSILQRAIPDEFRGRTFSLYDVVFNVAFVAAASVGAFVLPSSGRSVMTNVVVSGLYAGTAVVLWRLQARAVPQD